MKAIFTFLGGSIVAAVFIAGFLAYFVTHMNPSTHQYSDGLGRALVESPGFMRLLFGQERLWPGWFWFFGDMIVFFGGLGLGAGLFNLADRFGKKSSQV